METYVIHVTKRCNMECFYCYEKDKTSIYTWEEIKSFIDKILKYRTSNEFNIEFLGGDPMLAWDYIRQSYEYLEGKDEINISRYIITCNGTIMTEEIADYLFKNNKITWAISLDGHSHANQLRTMKVSNENSYKIVMENIKLARKFNIEPTIHMVIHPYNVGFLSDSIFHLYKKGLRFIDAGIVESTIQIDDHFAKRFIKEMEIVSEKIVDGTYPDLSIGIFNWLKPYEDIRNYIRDDSGKVIGETYGRSGRDITYQNEFNVQKCEQKDYISELIYFIRKSAYEYHQKNLKGVSKIDY